MNDKSVYSRADLVVKDPYFNMAHFRKLHVCQNRMF